MLVEILDRRRGKSWIERGGHLDIYLIEGEGNPKRRKTNSFLIIMISTMGGVELPKQLCKKPYVKKKLCFVGKEGFGRTRM